MKTYRYKGFTIYPYGHFWRITGRVREYRSLNAAKMAIRAQLESKSLQRMPCSYCGDMHPESGDLCPVYEAQKTGIEE